MPSRPTSVTGHAVEIFWICFFRNVQVTWIAVRFFFCQVGCWIWCPEYFQQCCVPEKSLLPALVAIKVNFFSRVAYVYSVSRL